MQTCRQDNGTVRINIYDYDMDYVVCIEAHIDRLLGGLPFVTDYNTDSVPFQH